MHFYQQAVLGGATHAAITLRITAVNVVLLVLALVSVRYPVVALATAAIVVAGLLDSLRRTGVPASSPPPQA